MAKHHALTDTTIRKAKPAAKARKLFDGGGLYLEISPAGRKAWRLKYRYAGKEKRFSLGGYPAVSLADARKRQLRARELLAGGQDPSQVRQREKAAERASAEESFEAIAREWLDKQGAKWTAEYNDTIARRLETNALPWLGSRPVAEIAPSELLACLRRIEARGAVETAHRVRQYCSQIFRYAVVTGRAERDPAADLKGALAPVKVRHFPSIQNPEAIGALLRAIDGYKGEPITRCALRIAPLVFVRPGELRHAEWADVDLQAAEWRIPAERMKMRTPHIVPLAVQAVEMLQDLRPLTGGGRFVFPSLRGRARPMSENTINGALRRLGYSKDEMTGHGFRSLASTRLNELGWRPDVIERQLAHAERDAVRAAYNYAEYLPERRRMMQAWADYLGSLRAGSGKVVSIGAA